MDSYSNNQSNQARKHSDVHSGRCIGWVDPINTLSYWSWWFLLWIRCDLLIETLYFSSPQAPLKNITFYIISGQTKALIFNKKMWFCIHEIVFFWPPTGGQNFYYVIKCLDLPTYPRRICNKCVIKCLDLPTYPDLLRNKIKKKSAPFGQKLIFSTLKRYWFC